MPDESRVAHCCQAFCPHELDNENDLRFNKYKQMPFVVIQMYPIQRRFPQINSYVDCFWIGIKNELSNDHAVTYVGLCSAVQGCGISLKPLIWPQRAYWPSCFAWQMGQFGLNQAWKMLHEGHWHWWSCWERIRFMFNLSYCFSSKGAPFGHFKFTAMIYCGLKLKKEGPHTQRKGRITMEV